MQLEDFAYFMFVPILMGPLLAVYGCLRALGWDARSRLFLDSWIVWLTWIGSSLVGYFVIGLTDFEFHWSRGFGGYLFTIVVLGAGLFANVAAIALAVEIIRRKRNTDATVHLFDEMTEPKRTGPKTFTVSVLTTFAACMSLVLGFAALSAMDRVYNYYYPPAPEPAGFHIYD